MTTPDGMRRVTPHREPTRGADGDDRPVVWAIVGPTASGKSATAMAIAEATGAEIVCCDAMQVYRRLDIGTAKPSAAERARVPHHALDLVGPEETFDAVDYQRAARAAIDDIIARGCQPLVVGGTGLYLRAVADDVAFAAPPDPQRRAELEVMPLADAAALLSRLDPLRAARTDLANPRRVVRGIELAEAGVGIDSDDGWSRRAPFYPLRLAVLAPADRGVLAARIDARCDAMLAAGWLDEVAALRRDGVMLSRTARAAIGYARLADVAEGRIGLDAAAEEIRARTRAYARRQLTWFRREPRAVWFDASAPGTADAVAAYFRAGGGRQTPAP